MSNLAKSYKYPDPGGSGVEGKSLSQQNVIVCIESLADLTISDALNIFKTQKRWLIFIVSKTLRHKKGVSS